MTKKDVKKLVERYPFLLPRSVWTGKVPEDYDYTYIVGSEIPKGWLKLFLQMCEDIRQPLIDANYRKIQQESPPRKMWDELPF